jgi:hypothetical protein
MPKPPHSSSKDANAASTSADSDDLASCREECDLVRHGFRGVGLGVCGDLLGPALEGVRYLAQDRDHPIARHERPAADERSFTGQKRRRGPATEAVALADVRPVIGVDADRNEAFVDDRRDSRIGVRSFVHLAARLRPAGDYREQHGPASRSRAGERFGGPGKPGDFGHVRTPLLAVRQQRLVRYPTRNEGFVLVVSRSITDQARTARLRGSGAGFRGPRERPSRGSGRSPDL